MADICPIPLPCEGCFFCFASLHTINMTATENNWLCMKEGSKPAFLNIYKEYYNTLFCYGFSLTRDKELTKDCIQEMFLELWDTKASLNPDVQNIRTYLCTWLRRKISRSQSREIRTRSYATSLTSVEVNQLSYEELLIAFQETEERKEKLAAALKHLTKKQLEIIKLRFFENLTYEEIAEKTTLSNRTLYNTIFLAIQQLRKDFSIVKQT